MRKLIGTIVMGFGLLCCGGAFISAMSDDSPKSPVQSVPLDAPAATSTTPSQRAGEVGSGVWRVPEEVKPGVYAANVPADGSCYWARLRGFDGELSSILANDNLRAGTRGRLTIKKSDKGVEFTGDCTWQKVG